MQEKNKITLVAVSIMLAVTTLVSGLCFSLLYRTAVQGQKARLLEFVVSRARLIEAMAGVIGTHHGEMAARQVEGELTSTREMLHDVLSRIDASPSPPGARPGAGQAEAPAALHYVIAERRGQTVHFLHNSRGRAMEPVELAMMADKPLGRALHHETGVVELVDHLGHPGISAYAPIASSGWGVVAKLDMEHIRQPFVRAALLGGGLVCLLLVLGGLIMRRTIAPLVERFSATLHELKKTQAQTLHQAKMAGIGQLAAGVAHEINNPIGFVRSNLQTLGKYVERLNRFIDGQAVLIAGSLPAAAARELEAQRQELKIEYVRHDAAELVRESLDGADRVSRIVQSLMSFSHHEGGQSEEADINQCLESTLNVVHNELKYKAEVIKEYGVLPKVRGRAGALNQVFLNLLVNAAQAIETFGTITIRTWADQGSVYVAIADSGTGIEREHLHRLFEPFFTTKEVNAGIGLGLSIAYNIVTREHAGEITVESAEGQGSTFTVRIPVASGG